MCGRYSITTPVEALSRLFRFTGPLPNLRPRYNVAPTQRVPIVRRAQADGERELAQVRWGLIPFWAKDEKIGYKLINARAEGIDAKPSFREAFKRGRRCLIAADGFYVKIGQAGTRPLPRWSWRAIKQSPRRPGAHIIPQFNNGGRGLEGPRSCRAYSGERKQSEPKIATLATITIDYAPLNAFKQIPPRILLKLHVEGAEIAILRYLPTWAAVP